MSEEASRLPARASLEQLRKQAKELAAADGVPLSQAQHAIARKYGFDSWPRLVQHVEALQPPTLAQLDRLAADLVDAFAKRDAAARDRVGRYLARIMSPQTIRARLRDHLGVAIDDESPQRLTLEAAREFVARGHGFESWNDAAEHMAPSRKGWRQPKPRATPFTVDWTERHVAPRHVLTKKDWDELIAFVREEGITGIDAAGQMTDDAMERVVALEHLTDLRLGGSDRLTDDGLLHAARLTRLERLELGGGRSRITDHGLTVLRHLPELRQFAASWSQRIGDAGMANLRHCVKLEEVDLMGTTTGDGTVEALAGMPALRLFKTGRRVTDAGLRWLHEFPVFRTWQGGEAKYALMSYDGRPNQLLLDGPITDAGVRSLAGLDGLSGLSFFWHTPLLTSACLASLAALPRLGFLGCESRLCDDVAMRHIAALPALRMLMGQGAVASDDGFVALSRSRTLEYLWGRDCPNLGSRGFGALVNLPALRGLGVSCKQVDDQALSLLPSFPALVDLMPMDVRDDGFRHVSRCEKLEILWCMYCRDTGDIATEHVAGLRRLKGYYAGNTRITDRSLEILGGMTSLEWIEIWTTVKVTDAGIANLAGLPKLRKFSVSGCPKVTRAGMAIFPPGVETAYST